ncbi:MAG: dTMP kinase [Armatimonadota bacterium]
MFVTFEGPEGAGKSTAIRGLSIALESQCHSVLVTREPGAGEFGQKIRALLLDQDEVVPEAELLLFLADRANHVENIIRPALAAGTIVLCDRHADSSVVYQGYARGVDIEFLKAGNSFATKGLKPHLTLLFDLDPVIGLKRIGDGRDNNRLDREPLEFHQKVRAGFLDLASDEPERWVVLDATRAPEALCSDALAEILNRLGR